MRVLVCGGRDLRDKEFAFRVLDELHAASPFTVVIEGGQRTWSAAACDYIGGADWWARCWADWRNIPVITEEADWKDLSHPNARIIKGLHGSYDANAGPRRNQIMIDKHRPDRAVALGGRAGTADMLRRARAAGIPTTQFHINHYGDSNARLVP